MHIWQTITSGIALVTMQSQQFRVSMHSQLPNVEERPVGLVSPWPSMEKQME